MGFALIFIPIVVIGIIASVMKEVKAQKKKEESAQAVKKFDEKMNELKQSENSASDRQQSPRQLADRNTQRSEDFANRTRDYSSNRSSGQRPDDSRTARATQAGGHHQSHCAVPHESKDRYRVEYVPVMNSIGGKSTEGCEDHYDVRFVKLDSNDVQTKELTDLQKAIVYGEVINNPAFRRNNVRR